MKLIKFQKGRLKWYEKSAKRKVNYKRSLRLGPLKWTYYALQIGNFWIRYEYGIVWMLNPDICIFFFRWSNQIQPSYLLWILYLRLQPRSQVFLLLLTLLLPVFTKHALLPIFQEEFWVLEWIWIPVKGQIRFENEYEWTWKFFNPGRNSCGFKNIQIRVEGASMNTWMACHPVSRC